MANKTESEDPGQVFSYEMEKRIKCMKCNKVKYSSTQENVL